MATIDEIAGMTRGIIAEDGFDGFLPVAIYPDRQVILALEGAPEGDGLEKIVLEWATAKAVGDEEFLVAFKVDSDLFKVIRRHGGAQTEAVFNAHADA
jgi:hypothetical protein